MLTLDDVRARMPFLALAVYAMEPGGPVTVEVIGTDTTFSAVAPTEAEALAMMFPDLLAPASAPEPVTPTNIFD